MIQDPKLVHDALGAWWLHLVLTGQKFGDVKGHLFLVNCGFICGPTHSRSSRLSLEVRQEGNQKVVVLLVEPAGLKVEAVRVSLASPGEVEWPQPLESFPGPES